MLIHDVSQNGNYLVAWSIRILFGISAFFNVSNTILSNRQVLHLHVQRLLKQLKGMGYIIDCKCWLVKEQRLH